MGLPNIGPLELIIVLAIALLIVGPRRLPEMGNAVGRTIREFRKASTEVSDATSVSPDTKATATAVPSGASGPGGSNGPDTAGTEDTTSAVGEVSDPATTAGSEDANRQA